MLTSSNPSPLGGSTSVDQIMKLATPSATGGVRGVFSSLLAGAGSMIPGVGGIIAGAIRGSALAASMPTLGSDTTQYLQLQQQIQNESIAFETVSTVLKIRHDCALHAIENMK
jgi:hypothetical protein